MIAIIDYDAGNIKSVEKAILSLGETPCVTRDPAEILSADHVILPGVGSFGDAMEKLTAYGLIDVIKTVVKNNTPFLGICLGQQLLFEDSEETPGVKGLGILKGRCLHFNTESGLKIPQIGWNSLTFKNNGRLFKDIDDESYVYFVHTYFCHAEDRSVVTATCQYADEADASIECGNIFACQFHPEKSGKIGLKILSNFLAVNKEETVC